MVFVKKLSLFLSFVMMQLEQEKPIAEVSEQKKPFLTMKNSDFKTAQNLHFSTDVRPWLLSKI